MQLVICTYFWQFLKIAFVFSWRYNYIPHVTLPPLNYLGKLSRHYIYQNIYPSNYLFIYLLRLCRTWARGWSRWGRGTSWTPTATPASRYSSSAGWSSHCSGTYTIYIIYNIYAYLRISGLAIYAVDRAGGGELNLSPAEAACRQLGRGGGKDGEKLSRNNESFSRGL